MEKVPTENSFLSYISPDPKYPDVGMVRITNSKIKYIAKSEGFYDLEDVNNVGVITDEERLVVKIMLNHNGSEIKNAAEISYGSWDSDARNAYNSVITNIERELNSIINEINTLKMYVYKEEEL